MKQYLRDYDPEENELEDAFFVGFAGLDTDSGRLQYLLKSEGISAYALSKKTGIAQSLLSMIKKGERPITESTALAIVQNVGKNINPDFLLGKSTSYHLIDYNETDNRTDYEKRKDDLYAIICREILPLFDVTLSKYSKQLGETLFRRAKETVFSFEESFTLAMCDYHTEVPTVEYQRMIDDIAECIRFSLIRFAKNNLYSEEAKHEVIQHLLK